MTELVKNLLKKDKRRKLEVFTRFAQNVKGALESMRQFKSVESKFLREEGISYYSTKSYYVQQSNKCLEFKKKKDSSISNDLFVSAVGRGLGGINHIRTVHS